MAQTVSSEENREMETKERILIVDDEPSIRKYLQTLLEVDGFDVSTVTNGKDAVETVTRGDKPDFIILDVLMPEMNGLETLRALMQVDRSLNIIMLSCSNEVARSSRPFASARTITLPSLSKSPNSMQRFSNAARKCT